MPSPLGHALAGMAAGWTFDPAPGNARRRLRKGWLFAVAATAADLDLLTRVHRGPTHSLAAAVLVGAAAWLWLRMGAEGTAGTGRAMRRAAPLRVTAAVAAAYATHTLLDWLGADSSPPFGIMALWPVSHEFYASHLDLFLAISRRYARPDFWPSNLRAVARELAILGPVALAAWCYAARRRGGGEATGSAARKAAGAPGGKEKVTGRPAAP